MSDYCHNHFRTTVRINNMTRIRHYAREGRDDVTVAAYLKNAPQTFTDVGFYGTPDDLIVLFTGLLEAAQEVKDAQAALKAA